MIIFIGLAGAGKSIQGRLLVQKINADYCSMGELLRDNVDPSIQEKMLTGELISDQDVIKILNAGIPKPDLSSPNKECILDGFPRSLAQVDWLIDQAKAGRFVIKGVIHLKASTEVIIPRLLERHRQDDNMEAINKRIEEYDQTILPILERLKSVGIKIYEVNAEQPIEDVQKDIISQLNLAA